MNKTKQLAVGRLVPQDLLISVSDSTRKIQPEIEAQADALWEEKKKKAEQD